MTHLDAAVIIAFLDADIATRAAVLRARHHTLRLPDALIIATADTTGADRLLTTDRKWATAKAMKLTITIEQIRPQLDANNHRFLTCDDFKVAGSDHPENCALA